MAMTNDLATLIADTNAAITAVTQTVTSAQSPVGVAGNALQATQAAIAGAPATS